jgi:DNA-directed RNA polymerase specialized sigma24 family protein
MDYEEIVDICRVLRGVYGPYLPPSVEADDLVQTALLDIWQRRGGLAGGILPLLREYVRRLALAASRKADRRRVVSLEVVLTFEDEENPDRPPEALVDPGIEARLERGSLWVRATRGLRPEERELILEIADLVLRGYTVRAAVTIGASRLGFAREEAKRVLRTVEENLSR